MLDLGRERCIEKTALTERGRRPSRGWKNGRQRETVSERPVAEQKRKKMAKGNRERRFEHQRILESKRKREGGSSRRTPAKAQKICTHEERIVVEGAKRWQ